MIWAGCVLPLAGAPDACAQLAYVAAGGTLTAIDTRTDTVIGAGQTGSPAFLGRPAISADGARVDAPSQEVLRPDRVLQFDPHSLRVVAFTQVGGRVGAVAESADGHVVMAVSNHVMSVIDPAAHAVVATIPEGVDDASAVMTPDGRLLFAAAGYGQDVVVVDIAARRVVARVAAGASLGGLAMSPDGAEMYVADRDGNALVVIDARRLVVARRIAVARGPVAVAVSPDGGTAYVAASGHDFADTESWRKTERGAVSVVDLRAGAVTAAIGGVAEPGGIAVTPDGGRVYVTTARGVTVIDTAHRKIAGEVAIPGAKPANIAIGKAGKP